MKKINTGLVVLFSATSILSCKSSGKKIDKWQSGTQISIYNGGGMVPESETVIISDSSGKYIHWHLPSTDTAIFILTAPELDSIAGRFSKAGFLSMKSGETEEVAYDKPSTTITWIKEGQTHKVTDGATEKITSGNENEFFGLFSYIIKMAKQKTQSR